MLQWPDSIVCGVDEAGRGPLAGPVVAAAVILDPRAPAIAGLNDSKKLSESRRDELALQIRRESLTWCVAEADLGEIDSLNILHASMLAMRRAVDGLMQAPEVALIDGNRIPHGLAVPAEAWIKGDGRHAAIAAASILAKTHRDALMRQIARDYPGYGFEIHMGYPTPAHLAALVRLGPCAAHRRSFGPVRRLLVS